MSLAELIAHEVMTHHAHLEPCPACPDLESSVEDDATNFLNPETDQGLAGTARGAGWNPGTYSCYRP